MTYLKFHYLQNEQDWNIPISRSELGYLEKKTNNVQECSKIESSKKNVFNFVKWLNRKNWVCFQVPVERAQTIDTSCKPEQDFSVQLLFNCDMTVWGILSTW